MSLFAAFIDEDNTANTSSSKPKENDVQWLKNSSFIVPKQEPRDDSKDFDVIDLESESSTKNYNHTNKKVQPDTQWLTNSSFIIPKPRTKDDSEDSDIVEIDPQTSRKKKKKHKYEKDRASVEKKVKLIDKVQEQLNKISDSRFYEDRKGSQNNFLIPTLMKDDALLYNKPKRRYQLDLSNLKKKDKDWRYYRCSTKIFESDETISDQIPSQTSEDILPLGNNETTAVSLHLENQLSKATASYNEQLAENPYDEELWLQYVDFQDEMQNFEKRYRKSRTNDINFAEKKLSILTKALHYIPSSQLLVHRKYQIKDEIEDSVKVAEELFNDLRHDPGNVVLWHHYINNTQCKLSRCSVPKVKSLYSKAMEKINFMQKDGISTTEGQLLDLFVSTALFLRQCGLWEQMLMLIRLNLQLNLTISDTENYKVDINLDEAKIQELEDAILSCGLPVTSLWIRMEKLRQRVYWHPVSDDLCDDPERVVSPMDVTDLVKPITDASYSMRIAVITMYLLKVPLIPLRDSIFRMLSLNHVGWQMDSAEMLLSIFCSLGITQGRFNVIEESIVSCCKDLVSYPQYVNDELGREEYLEFVQKMFRKLSDNLSFNCQTIMLVWWLRFERTLLIAGRQPENRKKRLKSVIKDLLKDEKHRNNLPLYIEYAFLEKELSQSNNNCAKILETALLMHPVNKNIHSLSNKNQIVQLYRILVEVLLVSDKKDRCLKLLVSLALSIPEKEIKLDQETITKALTAFQNTTESSFDEDFLLEEILSYEHVEPQFYTEWIYCQAWFLYLTESIWTASVFLEELLQKMNTYEKNRPVYMGTYYREITTEILITILHFHCNSNKTGFKVLHESLQKGITEFPNNMLLLGTFADLETKLNFVSPWWKIEKCLKSNDSQVAKFILILLSRRRLILFEKASAETLKVLNQAGPVASCNNFNNRMKALLMKLTRDRNTQQCPLIWIIYLQYCGQYGSEKKCKEVFYLAIERCPWIKALYMEGAHILPDQVTQIQDLIIEKEIRIHITQDEIQILKEG